MKRKGLSIFAMLALVLVVFVSGCSSSNKGSGSNDGVSVKILSKQVMVRDDLTAKKGKKVLAFKVKVKNEADKKLIFGASDFKLKDSAGNSKSTAIVDFSYHAKENIKDIDVGNMSKGESKTGYVFFDAKPGAKYDLVFKPVLGDKNSTKDVTVEQQINTAGIKDESTKAQKAGGAYVQAVFFDNNTSNYKKYVANDLKKDRTAYDNHAAEQFLNIGGYSMDLSDKESADVMRIYKSVNKKKSDIKTDLVAMNGKTAVLQISGKTVKADSVFEKYHEKYSDEGDINLGTLLDQYTDLMDKQSTKSFMEADLIMKKDGSKWRIVNKGNDYELVGNIFNGDIL
ncbi:DUF5105 domain-containing protein [Companilactobacillus mishanensis]|uniref:DUF5105 domain-containing protein n=1 Tax=Companilactobacillus mishanensis TaxID=2486008 RepID=UPI001296145B|nr:DUF5105 domain-containing protein [Companilactobacillus mishanensis]MQS89981.1 DUF5105 domain-containing protein [Companilactobacillus mishanensis]